MSGKAFVFADWDGLEKPTLVGTLRSSVIRQREHFSFSYDADWLRSPFARQVDPDLELHPGEQHGEEDKNFRAFLDSCPDRWGRLLMKRREATLAHQENRQPKVLHEIDYLLGVHDLHRSGALRFKRDLGGPFLDDNKQLAAPPLASLDKLQRAAAHIEANPGSNDPEYLKWLHLLISPSSSLGGARPKASVSDESGHLWVAKFPSQHDNHDIGAWEYVAYQLAMKVGVAMAESRVEKFAHNHHTFLSKRFDRTAGGRLHFSSAMTQLGYYDGDYDASYLELAQFLTDHGSNTKEDLAQLWRRIVFHIAISNTDDHLRNHGFIHHGDGWRLSPAFDINPTTPANGLHLNITDSDNRLDYELALEVTDFFQLSRQQALKIKDEVLAGVAGWRSVASGAGISRGEQESMKPAFNL